MPFGCIHTTFTFITWKKFLQVGSRHVSGQKALVVARNSIGVSVAPCCRMLVCFQACVCSWEHPGPTRPLCPEPVVCPAGCPEPISPQCPYQLSPSCDLRQLRGRNPGQEAEDKASGLLKHSQIERLLGGPSPGNRFKSVE